jgi:spore coat polysaccharide biosynthesis protein SpsF
MKPRIVAIIQARMASTRLPDKVLLAIGDRPMLAWVYERTRMAQTIDEVVVATTTDASDNAIQAFCQRRGYPVYRGSAFDVLDRYYQAARSYHADIVVRITADCPLIDPGLIDQVVSIFLGTIQPEPATDSATTQDNLLETRSETRPLQFPYDFACNRLPPPWGRTYPIGLDIEVCSFHSLELAWREAQLPHQREHVMPFFYEQPQRFRIYLLNHPVDYGSLRWTVDTTQDLQLLRQISTHFAGRMDFSWLEVLQLVRNNPHLAQLNAQVQAKDYRAIDQRSAAEKQSGL